VLQVFIGYDPRETIAFYTLAHSILRRSSIPVSITALMKSQLKALYTRPRGATESTEFSMTRFLVPALSGFSGWSVFMDCDMLCLADIAELAKLMDPAKSVLVRKHDYVPRTGRKFLNQVQTKYERKNWSSLMLFNNERCRALTPQYVNSASGLELHRFQWTEDPLIGDLPREWNWLVGEYDHQPGMKLVHYTLGGPWFDEYRDCDYAEEWRAELESLGAAG